MPRVHWPRALMPADRGRYPPPAVAVPSPQARLWLNARRIAADSSPPDRRWLKPAGLALTHARRPPLSLAPWIKSTCHGQECPVVLLCPQEHFKLTLSCLVHGDSSGAGGSSCSGHGGHSQPPAPLLLKWRRSLRDPVRASDSWSCPEEASASELALEGFLFLWAVLSCLSGPGGLSCLVLYCYVCPAPEGSWYPLTSPGNFFFWGGRRVPAGVARPRDEATAMNDHLPWPPELPAPPWPPELPAPPWPPELPAPPWPPLSVPLWRSPSCVPVRVCPEGPPERPPPLPGGTVTAWDTPSGRGELCQGYVVSCPCFMSLWVNLCPAVCMWLC